MREFLKELEISEGVKLDKNAIDKIMTEYGKNMQTLKDENSSLKEENTKNKNKLTTYETEISSLKENSKSNDEWKTKFEELDSKFKKQEEEAKKIRDDEILTNNIMTVFGDKEFTSDYVKKGLINDIKVELNKDENKGKGISDIFASLTKDKEGLFKNPNTPASMPGMGNIDNAITKDAFEKMGYRERLELKQNNPNLYQELNK